MNSIHHLLSRASEGFAELIQPDLPRLITDKEISIGLSGQYEETQRFECASERLSALEEFTEHLFDAYVNFLIVDQDGSERVMLCGGHGARGRSVLVYTPQNQPLKWPEEQTKHSEFNWVGIFDYLMTYGVITVAA
jgi:hypothetical protein